MKAPDVRPSPPGRDPHPSTEETDAAQSPHRPGREGSRDRSVEPGFGPSDEFERPEPEDQ